MKSAELNKNDKKVLSALGRSDKPLSAYDILERARSDALKAPVQVYRALEKLSSQGLVHRIEALNAFVACSDCAHAGHDHETHAHAQHRPGFIICRDCGSVREFEDERVVDIAEEAAGADFSVELVSLEVYGRCAACQARV
jgi:Fur family transcriptional regulator, zinc uptake regulator